MTVLTPPVECQLDDLKKLFPGTNWSTLSNGTVHVMVPGVDLPKGWSAAQITIHFVLPLGYPVAQPDCFWTDKGLRLADGRTPQNTGIQQLPGTNETFLWFSWHLQVWNPNEHTALTWLRVIRKRFDQVQ
jgi:hypothetical protein